MDLFTPLAFYAAFGAGIGTQDDPTQHIPAGVAYEQHDRDSAVQGLLGVRAGHLGLELGAVRLPEFHRHAHSSRGEFTADITQDITAKAYFARAVAFGPEVWRVTPFVSLGMASVHASNHEYGYYVQCGRKSDQDYAGGASQRSLIAGIGAQVRVTDHLFGRLEYAHIPHGTTEMHMGNREYSYTTLSLGWRF